jgi:radical SAM protein with 4Fe4S-binding SPASM domain
MARVVTTVQQRAALSVKAKLYAVAEANSIPLGVVLETTKRCNLTCRHCYVSEPVGRELSAARYIELVDELADAGCLAVTLTGGELALSQGWKELARRVRHRRMMLTLMTNGTLWGPEDWRFVATLRPRRVCVSLYASRAALHDTVTGVEGSFDASVTTLTNLRRLGVRCRIGSVMMPDNVGEVAALRRLAGELDCEFLFDPTVQPCDDGSMDVVASYRVTSEVLGAFYADEVIADRSREGRLAFGAEKPKERSPRNCGAGVTGAFVSASGDVFPCMGFGPPFGNIVEADFASIWRGSAASRHRQAMRLPLRECLACDLKDYCTARCPRLALVEDGDLSGPSRRACELAALVKHLSQM